MHIAVFDTHNFERDYLLHAAGARHELNFLEVQLTMKTADLARGAEAISIFVNDDASAPVLEKLRARGVNYVALRSAGFNHIDLDKARALGMRAANVPAYSPYAVAEHTVALMLALNRKLTRAHNRVRDANFSLNGLVGFDMNGKTAGVVGTGKIGAIVAKILRGFGCKLLAFDAYPNAALEKDYGLSYVSLETLCRESDIITLHTPLTPETKYLINAENIALMKQGAMLVNTSRGGLVKTVDVIDALKTGKIGYLGLDVYEEEKGLFFYDRSDLILQDEMLARLMSFPNVLITSHQAFLTDTALQNIADVTFQNIDAWASGKKAEYELTTT